jgi:ArsR family transcriptional regulator, lead/cadmium/zinc/bismuth-responsive transcriptional repressor
MNKSSYVQVREGLLEERSVAALAETFKVLGDATRVRILDALARAEVPVCDLAHLLGLTQSAVSHQLRLLRSLRLVRSRRDGKHVYYLADDHHIVALIEQGLEHVRERTPGAAASNAGIAPARGRVTAPRPTSRRVHPEGADASASIPAGRARRA